MVLWAFDPTKPTYLVVDACYDAGFGYILYQLGEDNTMRIIMTCSTGISDAQNNYSVYELKLTGANWAVGKCSRYLVAIHFTMLTYHRHLVGIENKDLCFTKNMRVIRLLEDLIGYDSKTAHRQFCF